MLAAAHADDGHWARYAKAVQKMERLTPSTPEDFLFKGYAQAKLQPALGLQTIKQAFDLRPMMGIALLLRAEVRALVAQDTDPAEAKGAVRDAEYAREFLRDNPAALWVSLNAHLVKAGVHEHRPELEKQSAELKLAGKYADALKPFTALPNLLPEAVVYRWLYFREVGREEEVLDELRRASKETDHMSVNFYFALTLYRRGRPGDFEEALSVLDRSPDSWLRHFVRAEQEARHLCLLGKKGEAVKASKALLGREVRCYTPPRKSIQRCLDFNAGNLSADQLLEGAGRSQWDQCLAHYHIAMRKLAEGHRKGAKKHFDKAVKTRAWGWNEYDMSWVFLSRLKDPTWPLWIPEGQ
jgi:hypothetical protein